MRKFFYSYNLRIKKLSILIIVYCLFVLSFFFKIQIFYNQKYKEIVDKKGWKEKTIYGERGKILDANKKNLAISIKKYSFWVNTNKKFDKQKIIQIFSESFKKSPEYYEQKLNKKTNYVKLEKNKLYLDCNSILEEINSIEGLRVEENNNRFYPFNNLACQTLGYVNLDGHAIGGIEENLNTILSGDTTKIKLKKGIKGKYYKSINESDESIYNGENVILTIDIDYQKILQDELNKAANKCNVLTANGIIIDPQTGDILAMASYPDFNPNNYFEYNIENFKNRVISDSYEPGSTFKFVALATALSSNEYNLNNVLFCGNGTTKLINNKFLRDHEPHGELTILDIFAHSSNIGISKLIDNFENIDFYKYCKNFGFGSKTGTPFSNEASGKIRSLNNWSKTSKNYISIGQELSITNIQLALAYASIANGGYLLKPNIIKEINNNYNSIYNRNITPIRQVINKNTAKLILESMEKVISHGTANNMNLAGYKIAGKTGTAQKFINDSYSENEFISSFGAIFPSNNPKFVIIVSLDSPKYGYHWANESAVPAVREIIKRIIINENKNPSSESIILSQNIMNRVIDEKKDDYYYMQYKKMEENLVVPNLKGKTLKEALKIARSRGLMLDSNNKLKGKIVWQSLKPGESFYDNEVCKIKLSI